MAGFSLRSAEWPGKGAVIKIVADRKFDLFVSSIAELTCQTGKEGEQLRVKPQLTTSGGRGECGFIKYSDLKEGAVPDPATGAGREYLKGKVVGKKDRGRKGNLKAGTFYRRGGKKGR